MLERSANTVGHRLPSFEGGQDKASPGRKSSVAVTTADAGKRGRLRCILNNNENKKGGRV